MSGDGSEPEPGPQAATSCALCGARLPPDGGLFVGGHRTCQACIDQLAVELAEGEASSAQVPLGAAGSLVGGLLGAAVWAGIALGTDYEIGYVAVLVGFLAGKGATLATGGGHGQLLQVVAVVGALLGLAAAKYALFAHELKEYVASEFGETIGYLDEQVLANFPDYMGEATGAFDLLWIFLCVTTAWRGPASPTLQIEGS